MRTRTKPETPAEIVYPDSDGKPLSDNTLQFQWIVTIKCGLDALFRDDPNVFIGGDLLWYPVEGDNKTRQAPDVMVAIGRPLGYRGSYKQWLEGGIAPQVVFEVLSPKNTRPEMDRKRKWYFDFGVKEYYEFDPDRLRLRGWIKEEEDDEPREILPMSGFESPRLGIRFELGDDLAIYRPDGRPLETYVEVTRQRDRSDQIAELERQNAEQERQNAEQERQNAERERQTAELERQRADRLAARLRELGLNPDE
jgi:Uma2 family endonuclease